MKVLIQIISLAVILASCSTLNLRTGKLSFSKNTGSNVESGEKKDNEISLIGSEDYLLNEDPLLASTAQSAELISDRLDISSKALIKKTQKDPTCDKILLKTGEEIEAKVLEIGVQEIKYKKCNNLEGPLISVAKEDVFMITYTNGSKEVLNTSSRETSSNVNQSVNNSTEKETHGLAIASFILGFLGPVGILAIIFGLIAKSQIKKNSGKYRGRSLATAGIVLGFLSLIIYFLVVAAMVA